MNYIKYTGLFFLTSFSFAQKIDVADLQMKVEPGKQQELYYAFDNEDKIVFTVEGASNNPVSEVSVIEYPETYKYKGHSVKKVKKEIIVNDKAVYKFFFANTTNEIQLCNIKIQRIPTKNGNKTFNTGVRLTQVQDTVWNTLSKEVLAGYDTIHTQKTRRVIASEKKYEEIVLDKSQRVSSKANLGDNSTAIAFTLPANVSGRDEARRVTAWAYWVGVGEESNEFWKQNRKMVVGAVQGATSYFTSPLGGIAAGALTNLVLPVNGEDVEYALVNEVNYKLFGQEKPFKAFDAGKGVAAYKRITDADMLQGKFYVTLTNDNIIQPIDVNVKVSAIMEHIKYRDEKYTDTVITPRKEKALVREPQIITRNVPVPTQN